MKILGLSDKESGCGYHRVCNPLGYIPATRYITNKIQEGVLELKWDIILFNRIAEIDHDLENVRNITGAKIVVDLDDDWVLPPAHLNYELYVELRQRIENNIRNTDLVTVTHERLADRCYQFNRNVEVIPNAVQFGEDQYTEERIESDSFRLFWAGGISHVNDMEILRNPMKRISSLKGISTVIGGYSYTNDVTKMCWDRMVSSFTSSLKIPGLVLTSLPVTEYMNHFNHADCLLLPLEDSKWHTMKSNLKLLEAAAKKIPVICSRVNPYLDFDPPVFYVERQGDWFKHVNFLLKNKEAATLMGNKLYEWAQQFSMKRVNEHRLKCFQSLLPGMGTIQEVRGVDKDTTPCG